MRYFLLVSLLLLIFNPPSFAGRGLIEGSRNGPRRPLRCCDVVREDDPVLAVIRACGQPTVKTTEVSDGSSRDIWIYAEPDNSTTTIIFFRQEVWDIENVKGR